MGVARKLKQRPPNQPSAVKPKKEAVAKVSKKQSNETKMKQVELKKSSRIRDQTLKTNIEPKADVINKKISKKKAQKPSSPPQAKAKKSSSPPQAKAQKSSSPPQAKLQKTSSPPQNKRSVPQMKSPKQIKKSARNVSTPAQVIPLKKNKVQKKHFVSSKTEKVEIVANEIPSKNARKKKGSKQASKNVKAVAKSVNTGTLAKTTKKITKPVEASGKAGQSDITKPSLASKLQKKKRKSNKSPLKKKLGGRIKKKSSLSKKKGSPAAGKKKKPSKTQLKLAVEQNRGVVYFSHLPHGFYERELKEYCGQFGAVTGVHVPRSVNGNSKGFAFVEFKHPEVAGVVAETMNNYLMHTRLLKAELVPLERQKPWIFRNGVNAVQLAKKKRADDLAARTRILPPEEEEVRQKRALARVSRLKKKLADKGINLDFTVVS